MSTREALLDALEHGPVSGPRLASELGVSRAAVWKAVESLREDGFPVESSADGYMAPSTVPYSAAGIAFGLAAPYDVEYHGSIRSTNRRARERAEDGDVDVVVIANEQTAGRGRLEREWLSPPGGVWLSLLTRPTVPPAHAPVFTLAAAVAIVDACRDVGVDAVIKWPNDVLIGTAPDTAAMNGANTIDRGDVGGAEAEGDSGAEAEGVSGAESEGESGAESEGESGANTACRVQRDRGGVADARDVAERGPRGGNKVAGILTEMKGEADRVSWIVVGVGVNANVPVFALPPGATSLMAERSVAGSTTDGAIDRRRFVQRFLERYHELAGSPDDILPAWRERSCTLGARVRIDTPGGAVVGTAIDVEFPGAIVVDTDAGIRRIHAGDCEHVRPARDA